MGTHPLSLKILRRTAQLAKKHGNYGAARKLGISRAAVQGRLVSFKHGRTIEGREKKIGSTDKLVCDLAKHLERDPSISQRKWCAATHAREPMRFLALFGSWSAFIAKAMPLVPPEVKTAPKRVFDVLAAGPLKPDALAEKLYITPREADAAVERAVEHGYNIFRRGQVYGIEKIPAQLRYDPALHLIESDERGVIRYGVVSDNHIGSKYARLDVLNDLYDFFRREGVTRVYNCGNWIDGEFRFNRHDLEPWAHGMDNQLRGFAEHYPRRKGITTYYIAGDDHEGWYEGVDIGRHAYQAARDAGREDLRYLGYMEAYIRMRHKRTRAGSVLAVVHPGGGSAYAISYSPQKIVESYQGGEKPAVVNFGHYHKMDVFNYRNVWIIQDGCTQDQTPFMRKKRIEAHVGGVLVELRLDPGGAVTDCITWQKRYFDRGYYNFQFDRAGPLRKIELPK